MLLRFRIRRSRVGVKFRSQRWNISSGTEVCCQHSLVTEHHASELCSKGKRYQSSEKTKRTYIYHEQAPPAESSVRIIRSTNFCVLGSFSY